MQQHHWLLLLLVFLVAYFVGVKFPSVGQTALSKIGM